MLADAVGQIYEAAAGFIDWSDALTTAAKLTESQYAILQGITPQDDGRPIVFIYDSGISPELVHTYSRFVREYGCPRTAYARHHRGDVYTDFAFIDERGIDRHPYYREVFEPCDLRYAAIMEIASHETDWAAGITLQRSKQAGPFEPGTLRLFESIAQHSQKALRMAHQLLRNGVGAAIADSMLAADASGYVLLDERGLILEMNQIASLMIGRSDAVSIEHHELRVRQSRAQCELHRAIRASGSWLVPGRASAPIHVGNLKIDVYPLDGNRWAVGLPVRTMLLLTEQRPLLRSHEHDGERRAADPPDDGQAVDVLREHYPLTVSESRVVLRLCLGHSVAEIAEQRATTSDAVRFHLKNVFQKLHVKRQSELIRHISIGPAAFVLR